MQELEAKFLMAPGAEPDRVLRRLQESLAWAGFRIQPAQKRRLRDTYYDTDDQQLRRAGWSYREREADGARTVALKEINRARAAIFNREEVEQALSLADGEDPRRPPQGAVQTQLRILMAPGAELIPLFQVATERALYRVSFRDEAEGLLEIAFDRSSIASKDCIDFIELEIELKEGPYDLLADVLAVADMEPGLLNARLSKYERGLITARCAAPGATARPRLGFDSHSSGLEVAGDYLKKQLFQIKLFEPYAWEGLHVEGVHQMRVAARRAASGLQAFAAVLPAEPTDRLAADLTQLLGALGAVRDLDVHLAHLPDYQALLPPHQHGRLQRYERRLRELHRDARCNLLKTLRGEGYAKVTSEFRTLLVGAARAPAGTSMPVGAMARAAIAPLLARVYRRGRQVPAKPSAEQLHRLRIAAKRLRYQLECLQAAYASRLDDVVLALKMLQDRLGAFQDACLAQGHLEHYRRGYAEGRRERRMIAELIDFERSRARVERKALREDWLRFREASGDLVARL